MSARAEPALQVDDLARSFGARRAVDGVSFSVQRGETFGLLGPNGAGKTTTIHMMVGALRPDSGTIAIEGRADPTRPEVRRRVGVAPQALSLYERLTGRENVGFFGKLYGLRGEALRGRVDWALNLAGLADRATERVEAYSGGMKRRLNLACALVHEPAVVFLDEPTVGIDPQSRNHIFETISVLKQGGLTILYTTHHMEEAQRLCDRVAIMDRGRILDVGTVPELIERHGGEATVEGELSEPPDATSEVPADAQIDGHRFRLRTDRPLEIIAELANAGLRFQTLQVRRPDLEAVFLTLTGRRLRD